MRPYVATFLCGIVFSTSLGCARMNDWIDPEAKVRMQRYENFEHEQRWYEEQRQADPSLPPRRLHGGII